MQATRILATAILIFMAGYSGVAQSQGIAFAEAPEQSSGVCIGDNPENALKCAREKCAGGGALPKDCLRVKWCYPAGWSADVFLQHREGPHWHEYLCGWDSREAVLGAVQLACDRSRRTYLIECAAVRLWSPEGEESEVK